MMRAPAPDARPRRGGLSADAGPRPGCLSAQEVIRLLACALMVYASVTWQFEGLLVDKHASSARLPSPPVAGRRRASRLWALARR